MIYPKSKHLLAAVFIFSTIVHVFCFAEEQIQGPVIRKGQAKPKLLVLKPIAQSPFNDRDRIIQEFDDLLRFDLLFSDAFQVFAETPQATYIKNQELGESTQTVHYDDWKRLQIESDIYLDYLVKTVFIPKSLGQYEINIWVYDVVQGRQIVGQAYGRDPALTPALLRAAGHKVTAEIITALTNGQVKPITQTSFAFVQFDTKKNTREIYLIDYDGWRDSLKPVTNFNSVTQFPDWSPDGMKIAYQSFYRGWPDTYIHTLNPAKVEPLARFKGTNTTPRWFPDGNQLVVSLSVIDKNFEIYSMKPGDKRPKRLTYNEGIDQAPDVSPSGDQIVYQSTRGSWPQIFVMNSDGSSQRRISYVDRKCDTPSWSPVPMEDGKYRIAFNGFFDNLQSDIYTVCPDGTGLQQITDGAGDNKNPSWSPNGKYIAFSSTRLGGKSDIYITSSDPAQLLPNGKRFHRITYLPGENLCPAWSPN